MAKLIRRILTVGGNFKMPRDSIKGIKYQRIIVRVPDNKGYDPSVKQIEDCTKIDLVDLNADIVLEFSDVCQPFPVWSF